jgi:succinoglycan biosynthesis transport protein ExoP
MKDNDLKRLNREYFQEIKTKRDAWNTKYKTAAKDARQRAIKWLDERADADLERRKSEARNRIAAEKAQSESNRRQAVTAELLRRGQERGDLLDRLKHLQAEYDRLLAKENLRREEIGGSAADLQFARAELQSATDVLTKLRNRHAAIRTERQSFGAVRTVAAATVPNTPVEKLPFIKMAGASGAVFLIPFLLALLWELKVQPKRTQGIM